MFRTVSIIALSWHEVFITSTPREGTYELLAKVNRQLILSLMGMVVAVNEMRKIHYIPLNWKRCNKRNEKCFHFINIIHSPNNSEASEFLVPPHPAKTTANRNTAMSCQFQRPEMSSYNIAWTEGWKFPRYIWIQFSENCYNISVMWLCFQIIFLKLNFLKCFVRGKFKPNIFMFICIINF